MRGTNMEIVSIYHCARQEYIWEGGGMAPLILKL